MLLKLKRMFFIIFWGFIREKYFVLERVLELYMEVGWKLWNYVFLMYIGFLLNWYFIIFFGLL